MDYSIFSDNLRVLIPVVVGLISFSLFWLIQKSESIKTWYLKKYGENKGQIKYILSTRIIGGIIYGLLPVTIYFIVFPPATLSLGLEEVGVQLPTEILLSLVIIVIILISSIPFVIYNAKKPESLANYPQIRAKVWNRRLIVFNLLTWSFYLLGYEFFFRGVLLFPLIEEIGLWPAVAVNAVLYSVAHMPNGRREAISVIPYGIIISIATYYTGAFWVSFIVHLGLAWFNSLLALKYHPDMQYVKNLTPQVVQQETEERN